MDETKMTSMNLPDRTRAKLEEIQKAENLNMTQVILKSIDYYYEAELMRNLITRLYVFKGKMVDNYHDKIDIKVSPVKLLLMGDKKTLRSVISYWSSFPAKTKDDDLFNEAQELLKIIQED